MNRRKKYRSAQRTMYTTCTNKNGLCARQSHTIVKEKKKHTHLGNKERQFIVLLIAIHSCSIERDHCALHIFASIKWFRLNFAGPLSLVPTLPSLSFVGSIRIGIRANSSRSPSAYDFDRNGNEMWFAWVRNELIGLFDKYEFAKFNK